jgi:hypothetical protein
MCTAGSNRIRRAAEKQWLTVRKTTAKPEEQENAHPKPTTFNRPVVPQNKHLFTIWCKFNHGKHVNIEHSYSITVGNQTSFRNRHFVVFVYNFTVDPSTYTTNHPT